MRVKNSRVLWIESVESRWFYIIFLIYPIIATFGIGSSVPPPILHQQTLSCQFIRYCSSDEEIKSMVSSSSGIHPEENLWTFDENGGQEVCISCGLVSCFWLFFYWVDFRDGRLGTISLTVESCFTSLPNKHMIELLLCEHIGVLLWLI